MSEKKLKIIGPYTPEHPGPFCTRDGKSVRIICTDRKGTSPIVCLVQDGGMELLVTSGSDGVAVTMSKNYDLMNAEEVPVAREFWINEYANGALYFYKTQEEALTIGEGCGFIRTIHVREVLSGDAE